MQTFALYVHLPFCVRKCPYCAFASSETGDPEEVEEVLRGIISSAITFTSQSPWQGMAVHSFYYGGGTPSTLQGRQIQRLTTALKDLFPFIPDAEYTIEANPGTLSDEKIDGWLSAGMNRISLGLQSLDDAVLKSLGRFHTAQEAKDGFQRLRQAGFPQISVDLIYGVHVSGLSNHDSLASWRETLSEVTAWSPEHISAYSLTIEEGTPFHEADADGQKVKLDEETELKQYQAACEILAGAGYEHYEVSNWAKQTISHETSSHRSRHNMSYWNGSPYLALGPSGHSFDPEKSRRSWNYRDTGDWLRDIQAGGTGEEDSEILTPLQKFEEGVMLGLRMIEGVEESRLAELSEQAGRIWQPAVLDELIEKGLMERCGNNLRYTQKGIVLANEIEKRLTE